MKIVSVLSVTALAFASVALVGCTAASDDSFDDAASSEDAVGRAGMLLVSDIDDTIKRTHVLDKLEAAAAAAESHNAFSGMSTLYIRWRGPSDGSRQVVYLSAAPGPLIELSKRFLTNSGFPGSMSNVDDFVIGGRSIFESAGDFKTKKLQEMYDAQVAAGRVPGTVVLVGDNGEQDMLAYGNYIRYVAKRGGRTDRIYSFIHHVYDTPSGSAIVAPHRPWVTAADLAVQMSNLGLLGNSALRDVLAENAADAVSKPSHVVPSFMSCSQFSAWPAAASSAGAGDYATVEEIASDRCSR